MPIPGIGVEIAGQSIVFFGIGFLLAGLVAIVCFPLVHNRAVRLTARRIETATPASTQAIQAERDHLRADFAFSARRLETSIEDLKNKTFAQRAALNEKAGLIQRLKSELEERAARIFALEARESELEAREKSLFDQLRAGKDEVSRMTDALRAAELAAAGMKAEQSKLESAIAERTRLVENQRIEIVALQTQIDSIRRQIYEMASDLKLGETRLAREWLEVRNAGTVRRSGGLNGAVSGAVVENDGAYRNGGAHRNSGNSVAPMQAPKPISS